MRKQIIHLTVFWAAALLFSPMLLGAQSPKQSDLPSQEIGMSLAQYPLISEIRGPLITVDQGEDYWISEGQIIEIWRSDSMPAAESGADDSLRSTYEKIGQARITQVKVQTSTAQILGESVVPIEVENFVRVHPEVAQAAEGELTIDRGMNQGIVAGRVVTIWRFEPVPPSASPDVTVRTKVRNIVGRAILTDVQPEMSTARILGKPFQPPKAGDFIRIETQTTVRQTSGDTVYINVATDFVHAMKPGMKVHVFRPYKLMHPNESDRVVRWTEKICTLKINHVAQASYTARAAIEGKAQRDALPGDLIFLEDMQSPKRMKAYGEIHVLKTEPNRLYLNRFEEAQPGIQLTVIRSQPMSDEIDSTAPICNLQVEAVFRSLVVAVFLSNMPEKRFRVGDRVRYAVYR